jgi:hypothetical protein
MRTRKSDDAIPARGVMAERAGAAEGEAGAGGSAYFFSAGCPPRGSGFSERR